jgi:hypothetical protein
MTKEADPNDDQQSFEDKVASRVWDLGRYALGRIDDALQQAVRDQGSPEEAVRRVKALLLEDHPLAEAHYRLGSVSLGEALRSLMLVQKDDPEVRSTAADVRRVVVADEHPRAAELEDVIAQMLVESLRGDPEIAEAVRALVPPPAPRKRRPSPLDAGSALAASPSAATKTATGKEQGAVDAKINHRKGAWRAHCGNPMRGGCRGALGQFEDVHEMAPEAFADFPPELRPTGRWVLRSDHGYGGNAKDGYIVLQDSKKLRRPLPERFGNVGGRLDFAGYWHGFVGQLPQPPCQVVCPLCKMRNNVGQPTDG